MRSVSAVYLECIPRSCCDILTVVIFGILELCHFILQIITTIIISRHVMRRVWNF